MLIDRATKGPTETILFNIDIEGFSNKDKTAVLRVFAKMFYNHLGFYGENLKVAMMERYIDQQGKTEEFRRVFEEKYFPLCDSPMLKIDAACKDRVICEELARVRTIIRDTRKRQERFSKDAADS